MKETVYEGGRERRILAALATDKAVLAALSAHWTKEPLFRSRWADLIAGWCVAHFRQHQEAPGQALRSYFENWVEQRHPDEETVSRLEVFLVGLSRRHEQAAMKGNPDHLLDVATRHFTHLRLERLAESLQAHVQAGEDLKADALVTKYARLTLRASSGVDVLLDRAKIRAAFERPEKPLVVYDGALGQFFGNTLGPDALVAFVAPEKSTKSFWLQDAAWRAMLARHRVAYFQVGDLSEKQMLKRLYVRAARHPLYAGTALIPRRLALRPGDKYARVERVAREFTEPLSARRALRGARRTQELLRSRRSFLRVSCHPAGTLDVHGLRALLQAWEVQEFVPEVVVIDYADILAPLPGYRERRDQINATWEALRALSSALHCLVLTATQANSAAYGKRTLDRRNFSEDKRKNAHVTGMVGINITAQEKEQGLCRLNWIQRREAEFSPRRCVHVAGCLALANPALLSTFGDEKGSNRE